MRDRVSRAFRSSISVLLFVALAVVGVPLGYLAATSGNQASVASRVDTKPVAVDVDKTSASLFARMDAATR